MGNNVKITLIILLAIIIIGAVFYFVKNNKTANQISEPLSKSSQPAQQLNNNSMPNKNLQWPKPPKMTIDVNKTYTAEIETSFGTMTAELFSKEDPITVNNFVFLAKQGFYNGTKFHRIIKNFMIQGGDPKGNGTGGPGYKFNDEPISRDYLRGTLAMANSGPNTNGSQFFIMHQDYPLSKNYVIFGKLVNGFDVLDKIASVAVGPNDFGEMSKPISDVIVNSINIIEK